MGTNINIDHQFLEGEFFFPNWKINTLVLGTFNPNCGEKTDYFYGRCRNNFWRTIENILNMEYMFLHNNFEEKLKVMVEKKFGCVDVIKSITLTENTKPELICGRGYSDQVLFNRQKCLITYQFEEIKNFISENKVKKVINTWGGRDAPKAFKILIDNIQKYCETNDIVFIRKCPSPSGRLGGKDHKEDLLNFYKNNLLYIL